jgi:hypothetical protein
MKIKLTTMVKIGYDKKEIDSNGGIDVWKFKLAATIGLVF